MCDSRMTSAAILASVTSSAGSGRLQLLRAVRTRSMQQDKAAVVGSVQAPHTRASADAVDRSLVLVCVTVARGLCLAA